ncbi:MAG: lipopolysaccharide kinase InaA family protein [Rikenellaceae bacterium]
MVNREIIINPRYNYLEDFVNNLPSTFEREGETIRKVRNEVKVFETNGVRVNVKRYCKPPFFVNRIIYAIFRDSKAKRAFEYAQRLLSLNIDTPSPIAYIEDRNVILLSYSYFVSIQVTHPRTLVETSYCDIDSEAEMILTDFGRYTADLHNKGIYHRDYCADNILLKMEDGKPSFCLIDINRMDFEEISMKRGCTNFNRFALTEQSAKILAQSYSEARGFNPTEVCKMMLKYREALMNKRKFKPKKILQRLFDRAK